MNDENRELFIKTSQRIRALSENLVTVAMWSTDNDGSEEKFLDLVDASIALLEEQIEKINGLSKRRREGW
jgi:lipoate synthase